MKDNQTNRKTICFAAPTMFRYFMGEGFGGAELQVYQLSRIFVDAGYRVVIFTNDFGQEDHEIREGIEIEKVPIRFLGGSNFFFLADSIRFVRKLINLSPDYCFVKNPNVVLFFVALAAKIKHSINPVKIFALDYDCQVDGCSIPQILYRFAVRWTNLFIFQTEYQKRITKEKLGKNGVVIHNIFVPPKTAGEDVCPTKDYDILWIGDFHPNKRPELFYEIAKRLPDYHFGMIAKSVPEKYSELFEKIKELDNVDYLGRVPFQQTQSYFNRSKVFICTSAVEGFPNCFLQSWWAKIPVVSLSFSCDGLLQEKGIGLVSGTIDKMCKDLTFLIQNDSERNSIGSNGFQYLEKNHLPETILKQYRKFMNDSN